MEQTSWQIAFQKLSENAILPTRGSEMAAGLDLYSAQDAVIPARGRQGITTGLAAAIPEGYYGRIAPRSGLAAKFGIDTMAGVVDCDYRGELICLLVNHSDQDFTVKAGDRVAQLVIEAIAMPQPILVSELPDTDRGSGGFGSTGHN